MSKLGTIDVKQYPFVYSTYSEWKEELKNMQIENSYDLDLKTVFVKVGRELGSFIVTGILAEYISKKENFIEDALNKIPDSFITTAYNPAYILKDYILSLAGYQSYDTMLLQDALNCIKKEIKLKELK